MANARGCVLLQVKKGGAGKILVREGSGKGDAGGQGVDAVCPGPVYLAEKAIFRFIVPSRNHVESGMTMTKDTIYYATWTGVYLIDVATGKTQAFLSQEF